MVLEVVILGFVVLIVAPILFIFWNIFLICIGRHPMQNPNMIKPEVGKLPKSVVDRIPLVMYIPPPPAAQKDATDQSLHSYPPKVSETVAKPPRVRFKFFRRASAAALRKPNDESVDEKNGENGLPDTTPKPWESNWEHGDHPFVTLEENQAACAICLMDFEEPKRKNTPEDTGNVSKEQSEGSPSVNSGNDSPSHVAEPRRTGNSREEEMQTKTKLTDAGDGPQPLRLLSCGHVFHKTCLDPWLTDVSGRCPVCQRPVETPDKNKKPSRQI
ncbi:unnamed protein product [Cyclocybe aegerita]|uniref:RING-type domain-containing protein n=1 Tax=Cyclocybe aegerita TaxID=1973307 RepID=A0A8S0VZ37_CYCAE|nr:unnamed protein product [Cyclocybe aegerita]